MMVQGLDGMVYHLKNESTLGRQKDTIARILTG